MAKSTILLDTRRAIANNKFPLKLRISHNSTVAYIALPYNLRQNEWDNVKCKIKKSCTDYHVDRENILLQEYKQNFDQFLFTLVASENINVYKAVDIKQLFLQHRTKEKSIYFNDILDEFILLKKKENPKSGTYRLYDNTKTILEKFSKNRKILLREIDPSFLQKLVDYLRNNNNKTNYISINLRNIRAVFNYAIKNSYITYNEYPFKNFKIVTEKTRHRALSIDDMVKLFNYSGTRAENKALDLFKLSFYLIGMNFKDLLYAKQTDIYNNRIEFYRSKTKKGMSIKIVPEAKNIIKKYRGDKFLIDILEKKLKKYNTDRTTELHSDVIKSTNKHLKNIAKDLEINVELSTYYARHSWATIARKIGIDYDIIRLALGHSNNDVTAVYIDYDDELIDDANEKVIAALNL